MKKALISLSLLLAMSLTLVSCSTALNQNKVPNNSDESDYTEQETNDSEDSASSDTESSETAPDETEPTPDTVAPAFKFAAGFVKNPTLQWGDTFNPKAGITATDAVDGNLTSKISVSGKVDTKRYGSYDLTYKVADSAGNQRTFKRTVTVAWPKGLGFIGHAGCYFGVMNTEDAFVYAAKNLKYKYIECDVKQTKDGVFVTCHDDTFEGYTLSGTNWSTLQNVTTTKTRDASLPAQYGNKVGTYTAKLCTLKRYLEICKEYGAIAVVELKSSPGISSSDQSRMSALMTEIKNAGMLDQVIILTSMQNCLLWIRQNGYNIPCQFLVNSCEYDDTYEFCVTNKFDVSVNIERNNSQAWIEKYQAAGRKVSCYTFSQYVDYPRLQEWINLGVDFVTCDWQSPDRVTIPNK